MRTTTLALLMLVGCDGGSKLPPDYSSGSATLVGGSLRVVMTRADADGDTIEMTTVARGVVPDAPLTVMSDGVPLAAVEVQIAGIDDRAYIVWTEVNDHVQSFHGAPLGDDASIDSSRIIELGTDHVELRRVGDRFLVVHVADDLLLSADRKVRGTWLSADGQLVQEDDLGLVDDTLSMTGDPDGTAGVWATAFKFEYFNAPSDLDVRRVLPDGTSLDTDGIAVVTASADATPGDAAIATLSDASVLVIYTLNRGSTQELHAARIPPPGDTGPITDQIVALPGLPQLVVRGDQVLALTGGAAQGVDVPLEARVLDGSGTVLSGPVSAGSANNGVIAPVATGDGFAYVQVFQEIAVTWLAPDGTAGERTVIATSGE